MAGTVKSFGGGSTPKQLVNASGEVLGAVEKAGSGKIRVTGGLGNTAADKVLEGTTFTSESGVKKPGTRPDITPEVLAQPTLVNNLIESLVGKVNGANATAETILKGFSAWVGQELVEGTYDPATADPDLIPENIREGIDIFGVLGTMVEGAQGFDCGTVIPSNGLTEITVEHGLGVVPKYVALVSKPSLVASKVHMIATSTNGVGYAFYVYTNATKYVANDLSVPGTFSPTATQIKFTVMPSGYSFVGKEYYWIART